MISAQKSLIDMPSLAEANESCERENPSSLLSGSEDSQEENEGLQKTMMEAPKRKGHRGGRKRRLRRMVQEAAAMLEQQERLAGDLGLSRDLLISASLPLLVAGMAAGNPRAAADLMAAQALQVAAGADPTLPSQGGLVGHGGVNGSHMGAAAQLGFPGQFAQHQQPMMSLPPAPVGQMQGPRMNAYYSNYHSAPAASYGHGGSGSYIPPPPAPKPLHRRHTQPAPYKNSHNMGPSFVQQAQAQAAHAHAAAQAAAQDYAAAQAQLNFSLAQQSQAHLGPYGHVAYPMAPAPMQHMDTSALQAPHGLLPGYGSLYAALYGNQ